MPTNPPTFCLYLFLSVLLPSITGCQTARQEAAEKFSLIEIQERPGLQVGLQYKSPNNLTGKPLYPKDFKAFARPELLASLRQAALHLQAEGYGIIVLDAWRPPVASALLWNAAVAQEQRHMYAPPEISGHTRGSSVDVTLYSLQSNHKTIIMPSPFDCHRQGKESTPHSRILGAAMRKAGFSGHPLEWWHFDHPIGKQSGLVENPWEKSKYKYRNGKLFKHSHTPLPFFPLANS